MVLKVTLSIPSAPISGPLVMINFIGPEGTGGLHVCHLSMRVCYTSMSLEYEGMLHFYVT